MDSPDNSEPRSVRDVEYKGAPLDAAKGPGLGCFWTQIAVLVVLVVLTPLSVQWGWPSGVSAALLIAVLLLLLISGQTIIFLLRLVAADRRAQGRRRPLASPSPTVGELEETETRGTADPGVARVGRGDVDTPQDETTGDAPEPGGSDPPGVRE